MIWGVILDNGILTAQQVLLGGCTGWGVITLALATINDTSTSAGNRLEIASVQREVHGNPWKPCFFSPKALAKGSSIWVFVQTERDDILHLLLLY